MSEYISQSNFKEELEKDSLWNREETMQMKLNKKLEIRK